jgi:hypothetical protein
MLDHTDVLLLKPAGGLGFRFDPRRRPAPGAVEEPGGIVVATIVHLAVPATADIVVSVAGESEGAHATLLARLVTDPPVLSPLPTPCLTGRRAA